MPAHGDAVQEAASQELARAQAQARAEVQARCDAALTEAAQEVAAVGHALSSAVPGLSSGHEHGLLHANQSGLPCGAVMDAQALLHLQARRSPCMDGGA